MEPHFQGASRHVLQAAHPIAVQPSEMCVWLSSWIKIKHIAVITQYTGKKHHTVLLLSTKPWWLKTC